MTRHYHFDLGRVLAEYDRLIDAMAKSDRAGTEIQVRIARLVGRAYVEFIVGERNLGTDGEIVAAATAAAVGNIVETLTSNFPEPNVALAFAKILDSASRDRSSQEAVKVYGLPGGQA